MKKYDCNRIQAENIENHIEICAVKNVEYRGYKGVIYRGKDEYYGIILDDNISAVFVGKTIEEAEEDFRTMIDF